jgi:hypothetical protein
MRLVALGTLVTLAACQRVHEVEIQLGPDDGTFTIGFQCRLDNGMPLVERAHVGSVYRFSVVIDLIDLGGELGGCRGEELVRQCSSGACSVVPRADGTRYCVPVELPEALVRSMNPRAILDAIRPQLAVEPITANAPDRPVLIRAVGTTQPCDELRNVPAAEHDPARVTGCAYSCPVQLDAADGPISLSLDALDERCAQEVAVCAAFPPD